MPTTQQLAETYATANKDFDSSAKEMLGWVKAARFYEGLETWSEADWLYHRSLYLCDIGLDLDKAMLLRAKTDPRAVEAIGEKTASQVRNLRLLAEHVPDTSRESVDALLRIAKLTIAALNYVALEKQIPAAIAAAKATESWPVLFAEHPGLSKEAVDIVTKLDVGALCAKTRIEKKARAVLTDPAGRLAALIRERIIEWRNAYQHLRSESWFWNVLPDWAVKILDLPDYDKDGWVAWWEVAKPMLRDSYPPGYLGGFLKSKPKNKAPVPLTDRLAYQALKSRFKGQAPA